MRVRLPAATDIVLTTFATIRINRELRRIGWRRVVLDHPAHIAYKSATAITASSVGMLAALSRWVLVTEMPGALNVDRASTQQLKDMFPHLQ